jgi:DNA-binding response OmpR family regulator
MRFRQEFAALLVRLDRLLVSATQEITPTGAPDPCRCLVITDGNRRLATEQELESIDPYSFDLFLDLTQSTFFTKVQGRGGRLRKIEETPLQSEDVNLLVFIIEHANRYFGCDNLQEYLEDAEFLERNTLAKRMARIRSAVQKGQLDGPFIRRTSQAHSTVSRTGFAFYFDGANVSYCLVRFAAVAERV